MRALRIGLGVLALSVQTSVTMAQDASLGSAEPYSPPVNRLEQPRIANTDKLIFQRAAYQAQQRSMRMEQRKWQGYSPQRPSIPNTVFHTDLNAPIGWPYAWGYAPVYVIR